MGSRANEPPALTAHTRLLQALPMGSSRTRFKQGVAVTIHSSRICGVSAAVPGRGLCGVLSPLNLQRQWLPSVAEPRSSPTRRLQLLHILTVGGSCVSIAATLVGGGGITP